jgi:hypothetical protein
MKRNFLLLVLIFILSLFIQSIYAETADNFNSRSGIPLKAVKGYLQGNCWFFSDFDVNRNGWAPHMEGDGAMVSGSGSSATERTGIFTPLLDMSASTPLSFSYKFDLAVNDRRWVKIFATDASDKPLFLLDSVELTGSNNSTVYTYHRSLSVPAPGSYRMYINYQGIGGNERIAIDQLVIGAATHYQSSCNESPVALRDKFTGDPAHTASGNVLSNDYDPNRLTYSPIPPMGRWIFSTTEVSCSHPGQGSPEARRIFHIKYVITDRPPFAPSLQPPRFISLPARIRAW